MEIKVQVPFKQLLTAVKLLTPAEKARLKQELTEENAVPFEDNKAEFIEMLLNGPVYTDEQIQVIEENRKSIAKWRAKS